MATNFLYSKFWLGLCSFSWTIAPHNRWFRPELPMHWAGSLQPTFFHSSKKRFLTLDEKWSVANARLELKRSNALTSEMLSICATHPPSFNHWVQSFLYFSGISYWWRSHVGSNGYYRRLPHSAYCSFLLEEITFRNSKSWKILSMRCNRLFPRVKLFTLMLVLPYWAVRNRPEDMKLGHHFCRSESGASVELKFVKTQEKQTFWAKLAHRSYCFRLILNLERCRRPIVHN